MVLFIRQKKLSVFISFDKGDINPIFTKCSKNEMNKSIGAAWVGVYLAP